MPRLAAAASGRTPEAGTDQQRPSVTVTTVPWLEAGPGTLQPVSGGKVGRRVADKIIQFLFQFDSGLVSWGQLFNCIEFVSCASCLWPSLHNYFNATVFGNWFCSAGAGSNGHAIAMLLCVPLQFLVCNQQQMLTMVAM